MKDSGVPYTGCRYVTPLRNYKKKGNASESRRTSGEDEDPCEAVVVNGAANHTTTGSTTNFTLSLTVQASQTVTVNVAGSRASIEISDAKPAAKDDDELVSNRCLSLRDDGSPSRQVALKKRRVVDYTDEIERPGNRSYQAELESHGTAFVRAATSKTQKDCILDHFLARYTFQRRVHDTDDTLTLSSTSARAMLVRALTKIGTPDKERKKTPRHGGSLLPPLKHKRTLAQPVKERRAVRQSERRDDEYQKNGDDDDDDTDTKLIVYCGSHKGNNNNNEPGNQAYIQAVVSAQREYQTSDSTKQTLMIEAVSNQFDFRQFMNGEWRTASSTAWVQGKIHKALTSRTRTESSPKPLPDSRVCVASAKSSLFTQQQRPSKQHQSSGFVKSNATTTSKQVVICGHAHLNRPGNIAYRECLASLHRTYRNMKNTPDRESVVDSVLDRFDFQKDDHRTDERYAREKIRRALVDVRHARGEKKRKAAAPSEGRRTKPRLATVDRLSADAAAVTTKAQTLPPMAAQRRPRLKHDLDIEAQVTGRLVVYCGSSCPKEPGTVAYVKLVRENRTKYKKANQSARALLVRTFLERFNFQRPFTAADNTRMWVRAQYDWTLEKLHAALRSSTAIKPNITSTIQLVGTTNQMEHFSNFGVVDQGEQTDIPTKHYNTSASRVLDVHQAIVPLSHDKGPGESGSTQPNQQPVVPCSQSVESKETTEPFLAQSHELLLAPSLAV